MSKLQQASEQRRDSHAAKSLACGALEERLHVVVAKNGRTRAESASNGAGERARVVGIGEPARAAIREAERAKLVRDDIAIEKILLNEVSERTSDALLTRGYYGGVRDGNAERMAKQRRDREPVGHASDDRCFRRRAHVAEPRMRRLEQQRDDEDDGRDDEHRECDAFHRARAARACRPRRRLAVLSVWRARRLRSAHPYVNPPRAAARPRATTHVPAC